MKEREWVLKNPDTAVGSLAWFGVHQFIGTYGIVFFTPYVLASAFDFLRLFGKQYPSNLMYFVLTGTPFFPLQILLGLILGWLIGRHFRHRAMTLVWVIPALVLLYAIVAVPTFTPNITPDEYQAGIGQSRFVHYFGWGCQPVHRCLDQATVTLPFYVAMAYSIGALLVRITPARFRKPNPRNFWVYVSIAVFFLSAFCSEIAQLIDLHRRGGEWHWQFLQPLLVNGLGGVLLVLYAVLLLRESRESAPTTS